MGKTSVRVHLHDEILRNLKDTGINELWELQHSSIDAFATGKNVIVDAPPKTGKTTAYVISTLHQMDASSNKLQTLVVVPSRTLVIQVQLARIVSFCICL